MFSKTIFKQTLKQNWKLWAIFTALTAIMGAIFIAIFDPQMMKSMTSMVESMPGIADMLGDRLDGMTSLLGVLGENFYGGIIGSLLPLVYIIMTANSLVASQVDRGSMAYTLSAPIKRTKVVLTQAVYMITSLICMFLVVIFVGFCTVQIFHHGLWGESYTADVKAASQALDIDEKDVSDDLTLILNNKDALKAGAKAREIDADVYTAYLNQKLTEKAYEAAAKVLDMDSKEVSETPSLIKNNEGALEAAAKTMKMEPSAYSSLLDQVIQKNTAAKEQSKELQEKLIAGISAAAKKLHKEASDITSDMSILKEDPDAMAVAVSASGLPEGTFTAIVNQQLAASELSLDEGVDFNVGDYLTLNFGMLLLMFAFSGISFLFSCVFNLTKNSLAFGAGIPMASLIFFIMSSTSSSLEKIKYLSLNTLYSPKNIIGGGTFWPEFIVLAVLGIVLYFIGIKVFKEKDLPL